MLTRCIHGSGRGLAIAVLLAAVAGCPKKESAKTETEPPAAETAAPAKAMAEKTAEGEANQPAKSDAEIQAEVEAILAKADQFDGLADKIVSKCAACALAMDGSPDYAVTAHGYTLHMCSAHCKESFEKDMDRSILAMNVPDSPPAEGME